MLRVEFTVATPLQGSGGVAGGGSEVQETTPRTDDLYDLCPLHDLDLSGQIDS